MQQWLKDLANDASIDIDDVEGWLKPEPTNKGEIMSTISIEEYRIVPAPLTGIGWYAVQMWNGYEYEHVSTFRSVEQAQEFIDSCQDQ